MSEKVSALIAGVLDRTEDSRSLLLLLGVSLVVKAILLFMVDVVSADSARYITAAHYYAQGQFHQGISVYPLPLFPMMLALFHLVLPTWELAALPATLLASVFTLVPIYWLTRDLFGSRAAFWAGTAFALSPYLNRYGIYIIRDPAGLFTFAWALYFAHRFIAGGSLWTVLLSVLFTLCAATMRSEAMFFLPLYLVFLIVMIRFRPERARQITRGMAIWIAVPLCLTSLLMVAMPSTWLYATQGDYLGTKVKKVFSADVLDNYKAINLDLKAFQKAQGYPGRGHNLITLVRTYMPLIYFFGVLECFFRMLYPLYGIPLIYGLRARLDASRLLALATGLAFTMAAYLFLLTENWISKRYLSLTILCFLPWVGHGSAQILERLRAAHKQVGVVLMIALLTLMPLAETFRIHMGPVDNTLKTAGIWLRSQPALKGARFSASDNRILLYAEHYDDIPHWGDLRTIRMKEIPEASRHEIVLVEPGRSFTADVAGTWDQQVLLKSFKGKHCQVNIYGSPQLAKRLAD